jgi:hypothetical protein
MSSFLPKQFKPVLGIKIPSLLINKTNGVVDCWKR